MVTSIIVNEEIDILKSQLILLAQKNAMNLVHPDVVSLSQKLDMLIIRSMKK